MTLPSCRLFLVAPAGLDSEHAAGCLAAALQAGDVASVLVEEGPRQETMVNALLPIARARDVAMLVAGNVALAKSVKADGVQVEGLVSAYSAARAAFRTPGIVGAVCDTRHAAMELGEAGADYVAFRDPAVFEGEPLIAWWAELFEVPCVALDPAEPDEAAELARQGADFVRPSDRMWESPEAARATVASTLAAIAGSRA